jgi:hypothetical protein
MNEIKKWIFTLVMSIPGLLFEIRWLIFVVVFGFLFDCLTAYGLNRRLKKKGLVTGKFSSVKFCNSLVRLIVWVTGIFFCHLIDVHVLADIQTLHLANWLTFLICIGTAVSIMENITTENDDPTAKLVQKVLVSKAERHIEVDINNDGKIEGKDISEVSSEFHGHSDENGY